MQIYVLFRGKMSQIGINFQQLTYIYEHSVKTSLEKREKMTII